MYGRKRAGSKGGGGKRNQSISGWFACHGGSQGTHRGYQILLLVNRGDVRPVRLLTYHLPRRWILTLVRRPIDTGDERTGIRSGYFWRMRSASALRFSGDGGGGGEQWNQIWGSCLTTGKPRPLTKGVLELELGVHCDRRG